MSASYVVFSTPHSRWIMRTPRDADGHGVGRGGPGPRSTTQIDDALRLSRSTDVWPDPTRYPKHGSHGAPARPARHHAPRPHVASRSWSGRSESQVGERA